MGDYPDQGKNKCKRPNSEKGLTLQTINDNVEEAMIVLP